MVPKVFLTVSEAAVEVSVLMVVVLVTRVHFDSLGEEAGSELVEPLVGLLGLHYLERLAGCRFCCSLRTHGCVEVAHW